MQQKERNLLNNSLYTELYQQHAAGIFAYVYKQTASREEAEDIVLEVFLSILQQPKFAGYDEQKQRAWLWTIARNKVVDRYRKAARRPTTPIASVVDTLYEDDAMAPEQQMLKQEEYAQLHATLQKLPELQQTVLRLHFGHGLSCGEIAPVIDKSEGTVRMLLWRTLRLLRDRYKKR